MTEGEGLWVIGVAHPATEDHSAACEDGLLAEGIP